MLGEGSTAIHGGFHQRESIWVYPDRASGQGSQASEA